jgi:preprotein translocase subunit SecG
MSVLLPILTFVLILVAIFLILVILMQKAKSDGGMGAALGGGMTEATFGADTGNVLTKATINASILFFVLSFALYLGWIFQLKHSAKTGGVLPTISAPMTPVTLPPAAVPAPAAPLSATPPAPLAPLTPASPATPAPAASKP